MLRCLAIVSFTPRLVAPMWRHMRVSLCRACVALVPHRATHNLDCLLSAVQVQDLQANLSRAKAELARVCEAIRQSATGIQVYSPHQEHTPWVDPFFIPL